MDIRQLEYFCEVCKRGTFSAAARELYISEQALSKSISSFESELGFALFRRSPRGLEMTDACLNIFEEAQEIVNVMNEFRSTAKQVRDGLHMEQVTIGFYDGFLGDDLDPLPVKNLIGFIERQNDVRFKIYEQSNERIYENVRQGAFDFGVYVGEVPPDMSFLTITRITLDAVVSRLNPLSKKEHLLWSDLDKQKIIHMPGKSVMHGAIQRICKRYNAEPSFTNIVVSPRVALEFAYENKGILFIDRRWRDRIDTDRANFLKMPDDSIVMHPPVSIVWRKDSDISKRYIEIANDIANLVPRRVFC